MKTVLKLGNSICPTLIRNIAQIFLAVKNRLDLFRSNLNKTVYAGTCSINEDIQSNCNIFLSKEQLQDEKYMNTLKKDMVKCYFIYGINANEYFVHHFELKTIKQRKEYISKRDKNYACRLAESGFDTFNTLNDKYSFYTLAKLFFKRDVCKVENTEDIKEFLAFAQKHKQCIVKPISSSWGNGCEIIELNDPNVVFNTLLQKDRWIVEELILQDDRMAVWNRSSVNTVRICSFRQKNGNIIQIYPFMKTGRSGSVVDNAGQGGVYMSVDSKTGMVCSNGMDEMGNVYLEHPDSHVKYENWIVPEWESLIEISKEVHKSLPHNHIYVGFDFALDKNKGWVLIEGNWGDFICQQSSLNRGIRKDILQAISG